MPRSFLVKKNKRVSPYGVSRYEQYFDRAVHHKEEKQNSLEEWEEGGKSAFVSFASHAKNDKFVFADFFQERKSPKSKLIPSHSPLVRKEGAHIRNLIGKIPPVEPIAVIYNDRIVEKPKETEKENFQRNDPGSPNSVPSVKGPLSQSSFLCQLCKRMFQDAFSLAQHKCAGIKHVEHRCPECDKVFSCPANLASHRRWHRPRSPGSNKPMKVQKRSSSGERNTASLKEENKNAGKDHGLMVKVEVVDADFGKQDEESESSEGIPSPVDKNNNSMIDLIDKDSATDGDKYACSQCGKTFKRQAYLRKHMNYHNNAKPYPCQYCGKIFRSQTNRAKHVLNHAVGPKAFTCSICGNGFASRFELDKHARIHNGEVFSCNECSGAFYSLPGLQRHVLKAHKSFPSM